MPMLKPRPRLTLDDFLSRAHAIHGDRYDYAMITEITGISRKVPIICPIHGVFNQPAYVHCDLGRGCRFCGYTKTRKSRAFTTEEFIDRATIIHNSFYDYRLVI